MKQRGMESIEIALHSKRYSFTKRVLDIVLSSLLLIICSPVLLVVSLLLYFDDGFPIFFQQTRVGRGGRPFIMKKFRTMPQTKKTISEKKEDGKKHWINGVPDSFIFKSNCPPETTRLGAFIRKYSLDELPQLMNVLKGEMSLVGPRPEVSEITDYYNVEQRQRLLVKPGITGFAQVNGRSRLTHGEKIKCDLYYVEHMSLKMDVLVLFQTMKQVIKPEHSY